VKPVPVVCIDVPTVPANVANILPPVDTVGVNVPPVVPDIFSILMNVTVLADAEQGCCQNKCGCSQ
jgi:hypothetical protein